MSDAEIKRRKQLQGKISRTTSTLGLGSLAALGTAAVVTKNPKALKKLPYLKNASPKALKGAALNTGVVSSGIGGVGGYNFAAYTAAESRKKKPVALVKSLSSEHEMEATYGEVAKAWTPTIERPYDPEEKRHARNRTQEVALGAAGGAGVATGGVVAAEGHLRVKNYTKNDKSGTKIRNARKLRGRGGKVAVAGAGALLASEGVRRKRESGSWSSYSKRDESAFGITHV